MKTTIKAKQDLFNGGKCFTKGELYQVNKAIHQESSLMDLPTTNDLGEAHIIGQWWRNFEIVEK